MEQLLCFPGWSGQRVVKSWMGRPSKCIPHTEQWLAITENGAWEHWIPDGEWGMVTWSMGTWTGLWLLSMLNDRLPKYWIALSPFIRLVAEEPKDERGSPKPDDVDYGTTRFALKKLLSAFGRRPETTLSMFAKQQGAMTPWTGCELNEESLGVLGQSLRALLDAPPFVFEVDKKVPISVVLGENDRLVSVSMAEHFLDRYQAKPFHLIEGRGHNLFYEELPFWPFEANFK